ncbi:MAG: trigger factor [Acidiferrobacterales bacterium]
MQVSVENTSVLGRRVKVTVPAERVEQEFVARIKRLGGQVKLPGFRPGKVPAKVLEQKFGGQVMGEIASDLIQSTFQEAVGQESLRPAGGPKIEPGKPERGQEFKYTAEFEVYPELKGVSITGVKIKKPVCRIGEEDIDKTIETLRKQRVSWADVEREARTGDQVVLDFVGKIDGDAFEGGTANDFALELGSGSFIPGFEDGLIGATADEKRTLDLTFPDDYAGHLQGKATTFEVTIKAVKEASLPEIDDEFVKTLGVESGDLEAFRKEVQSNLERESHQRLRAVLSTRVVDALIENNPIEIPEALIDAEMSHLQQNANNSDPSPAEPSEVDRERARRRVATGLLFAEVMANAGIKSDADKVRARVEEMACEYDDPEEFKKWFYADPSRLREIEGLALEELVVAVLLKDANVTEDAISFRDLAGSTTA